MSFTQDRDNSFVTVPTYFQLGETGLLLYKLPDPVPTPMSAPFPTRGPVLVLNVDWDVSGGPVVTTNSAGVADQIIYNRQWRDTKTGEDKVFDEVLSWQGGINNSCLYYGGQEDVVYAANLPDGTLVDYVYQVVGDLTRYTHYYTPKGLAVDGVAVTDIDSVTGAGIYNMPSAEFISNGGDPSSVVDGFVPVVRFLTVGGTGNDFLRYGARPLGSPSTVLLHDLPFTPDLYSDVTGEGSVVRFNSLGTKALIVTVRPSLPSLSPQDRVYELVFSSMVANVLWQREFGSTPVITSSDSSSGGTRTQTYLEAYSSVAKDSPAADYVEDAPVILVQENSFSYETHVLIVDISGTSHNFTASTEISQSMALKVGSTTLLSIGPIVTSLSATASHSTGGSYVRNVVGDWANLSSKVLFADIPHGLYILVTILEEATTPSSTWTSAVEEGFGAAYTSDTLHITYTVYVIKDGVTIFSSVLHSFDFYPSSVSSLDLANLPSTLVITPATSTLVRSWTNGVDADACVFTDDNGTESIAVSITSRIEYPNYPAGAPYYPHKVNISKAFRYHASAWHSIDLPDTSAYYAHMVYGDYT